MRQTVIGLFNTYAEADGARNALVQSGFDYQEVELRANPEIASDAIADESPGVLANIERFFTSLFATSGSSADKPLAEHYTDAVRHGAVLVSVDAATDSHAALAHNTLMRLGARDVSERAHASPAQRDDAQQAAQTRREHSMLDELGIGAPAAAPTAAQPPREPLRAMEEERRFERIDAPPHDTPIDDEAARTAIATGGAPGSGAVLRPDMAETGRRALDDAAMREEAMRSNAPPAPPRDEFSRASGAGLGVDPGLGAGSTTGMTQQSSTGQEGGQQTQHMSPARAAEPGYPAQTVHGAAQYQSDPSDLGRVTSLPGHGLWQRETGQRSGQPGDGYASPESGRATGSGRDAQAGVGSDLYSDDGRGGYGYSGDEQPRGMPGKGVERDPGTPGLGESARGTPGMMNEHEARQNLRGSDYSPATVGGDAMRRPSDDTRAPLRSTAFPDDASGRNAPATRDDAAAMRGTPSAGNATSSSPSTTDPQAAGNVRGGGLGAPIPDEFLEYEEDFRMHYDEQYGTREGARYDEYVPAYRYGATMGRDTRYHDRPWDDDVELEARHDWERAAPEGSWDRFKAAVRHGWERVTGHHPHHH
jgi:hypothetical protein